MEVHWVPFSLLQHFEKAGIVCFGLAQCNIVSHYLPIPGFEVAAICGRCPSEFKGLLCSSWKVECRVNHQVGALGEWIDSIGSWCCCVFSFAFVSGMTLMILSFKEDFHFHKPLTKIGLWRLNCFLLTCCSQLDLSDSDKEKLPHVVRWMDYIQVR